MGFISFEGLYFVSGGGLSPPKPMPGYVPANRTDTRKEKRHLSPVRFKGICNVVE